MLGCTINGDIVFSSVQVMMAKDTKERRKRLFSNLFKAIMERYYDTLVGT